ncbi:NapC/NirT family cytochrome c [Bacillus sp. FJAT-27445]|uniref:cytochrome c3 family protein n=1 Tax=Bacillus sp. FJAT-27445 TaxID=1679166 RepID=UPI0007436387|nr:NapC/NirT family cytochrome c [Bacillus sp. FJAT-27445]
MLFWNIKNRSNNNSEKEVGNLSEDNQAISRNPIRKWKLLVGALTAIICVLGFGYGALSYASTPSFCASCHEIAPQHATFQASAHNQIKCVQCHIKPSKKDTLVQKVEEAKRVVTHFINPPTRIVTKVAISNENCEKCHSTNRLVTATGDIIVNHGGHIEKRIPCITCHNGVVHAKVVERGISDSDTYQVWTEENIEKLVGEKYEKPNMGTCIDCHAQVNQGKRPWKDSSYILPDAVGSEELEEVPQNGEETPEMRAGTLERQLPENAQKVILEAIGQQKSDSRLSMQCFTCHQKINTPKNHGNKDWSQNHGSFAVNELAGCLNCHKDSLWLKKLEKQDIRELLTGTKKDTPYERNLTTATKESRSNYFCSICHAESPANHKERYTWLYDGHRKNSGSPEERKSCFVCHDNEKPEPGKETEAPSDVYCEFCHEGDFPGEPA